MTSDSDSGSQPLVLHRWEDLTLKTCTREVVGISLFVIKNHYKRYMGNPIQNPIYF